MDTDIQQQSETNVKAGAIRALLVASCIMTVLGSLVCGLLWYGASAWYPQKVIEHTLLPAHAAHAALHYENLDDGIEDFMKRFPDAGMAFLPYVFDDREEIRDAARYAMCFYYDMQDEEEKRSEDALLLLRAWKRRKSVYIVSVLCVMAEHHGDTLLQMAMEAEGEDLGIFAAGLSEEDGFFLGDTHEGWNGDLERSFLFRFYLTLMSHKDFHCIADEYAEEIAYEFEQVIITENFRFIHDNDELERSLVQERKIHLLDVLGRLDSDSPAHETISLLLCRYDEPFLMQSIGHDDRVLRFLHKIYNVYSRFDVAAEHQRKLMRYMHQPLLQRDASYADIRMSIDVLEITAGRYKQALIVEEYVNIMSRLEGLEQRKLIYYVLASDHDLGLDIIELCANQHFLYVGLTEYIHDFASKPQLDRVFLQKVLDRMMAIVMHGEDSLYQTAMAMYVLNYLEELHFGRLSEERALLLLQRFSGPITIHHRNTLMQFLEGRGKQQRLLTLASQSFQTALKEVSDDESKEHYRQLLVYINELRLQESEE